MVRQGCAVQSRDGQARYYDLKTGQLYMMENNPSQQRVESRQNFQGSHRQPQASHSGTARGPGAYGPAGNTAVGLFGNWFRRQCSRELIRQR